MPMVDVQWMAMAMAHRCQRMGLRGRSVEARSGRSWHRVADAKNGLVGEPLVVEFPEYYAALRLSEIEDEIGRRAHRVMFDEGYFGGVLACGQAFHERAIGSPWDFVSPSMLQGTV